MKPEFEEYLDAIETPDVYKKHIERILDMYTKILPEEITDIFVEENVSDVGERSYIGLSLFSKNYYMEIPNFARMDDLAIHQTKGKIDGIRLFPQKFDFILSEKDSKLRIQWYASVIFTFELTGTGKNCEYLTAIYKEYIRPSMYKD